MFLICDELLLTDCLLGNFTWETIISSMNLINVWVFMFFQDTSWVLVAPLNLMSLRFLHWIQFFLNNWQKFLLALLRRWQIFYFVIVTKNKTRLTIRSNLPITLLLRNKVPNGRIVSIWNKWILRAAMNWVVGSALLIQQKLSIRLIFKHLYIKIKL
jgi:hypothetical protein